MFAEANILIPARLIMIWLSDLDVLHKTQLLPI